MLLPILFNKYIKLNKLPYYKNQSMFKHWKWFYIIKNEFKLITYYYQLKEEKIKHITRSFYNNISKEWFSYTLLI